MDLTTRFFNFFQNVGSESDGLVISSTQLLLTSTMSRDPNLAMKSRCFKLSNGLNLPAVGLGTYRIRKVDDVRLAVNAAIRSGYRLIDTAAVYNNEDSIAQTLEGIYADQAISVKRENIFITTKLAPKDHGTSKCQAAIEESLKNLRTDHLDLYLVHWPGIQGLRVDSPKNSIGRLESWRVLEDYYERGVLKSIGVSNYSVRHLEELLEICKVRPHVNQVEVHPHFPQTDLIDFCVDNAIHVQAYSSLGTTMPQEKNHLLNDTIVTEIAKEVGKTPAQVLLRWALEKGLSVIPKSINPDHIAQNIELDFEISSKQLAQLDSIGKTRKYAWNPDSVL